MALNHRITRVLLENKAQYLGSIVLIIFSTFTFSLMTQFAMNFERQATEFETSSLQEDAAFTTEQAIADLPALEAAANARIEAGTTLDYTLPDGKKLRIFSQSERVNIPAIVDGEALGESGDMLISPVFAAANDVKIGDVLNILDRPFTITGFMALPNYIYPLQSETDIMPQPGFGIAVISKADFAALGQGSTFYAVRFNDTAQDPLAQSAQFRELLTSRGIDIVQWTDIEDNKRVNIVAVEIEILNLVSRAVPAGILLLTSIMVANVIWRLIDREAPVIGALYALGYRRKEIQRHYLMFPLLIALIGGIIGTILGTFPVRAMVAFMFTAFIVPLTTIEYSPVRMLISVLLPVLFLGGSGYFVIWRELRHAPVELMRGKAEQNKVNFLERALKLDRLNFATKFRIREQLRSLSRLAFLLVGIIVATMLLLWGFALKSGFDNMLTSGLTDVYHFTYEYKFDKPGQAPLPADAEPISAALFVPEGDDRRDFYVSGVKPDATLITLEDETGASLSMDQVIMTRPLANRLEVVAGDAVNIVRKPDGRIFSVQIDAVSNTYAGAFIFMPLADYYETFEVPEGSYTGAFSNVLLEIPESQPYTVITMEEKIAGVREAIAPTEAMIGFLATVAFIIGVIVIYVVTSLIVEENRNVISLMKIFGYRKREINSLILNSSTIVVVIGYLAGIPLILAALGVLVQALDERVGLALPPLTISPLYLLIGFVVVLLAYELSKLLCRKKVNAISMSEALKAGIE
ncbi:MAG: ABC transporter permease [Caldilineaceae bacterium]|nr:ABC transporter permease [Caldilineaceae bacterium]